MSEDKSETPTRWENMYGALENFQSSIEAKNKGFVEAGKEKAVDLLNTSKNILTENTKKAIDAFSNLPNKNDLAQVIFGTVATTGFETLAVLGSVPSVPGREWIAAVPIAVRATVAAIYGGIGVGVGVTTGVLAKEWIEKSFPRTRSENK